MNLLASLQLPANILTFVHGVTLMLTDEYQKAFARLLTDIKASA
jgi:hypothetical protein